MLKILQFILKWLAKGVIWRYNPRLIGITGSIGKTSAKDATAAVLSKRFRTHSSQKNYNNELGVPLTIINAESGGKSISGWLKVFVKVLWLMIIKDKNYPELIVLEMGVDKPGDMDYLLSIVKLEVAILTYVGSSHLEQFGGHKKLAEEKAKIFNGLVKNGTAIINSGNEAALGQAINVQKRLMLYGSTNRADLQATEIVWKCSVADTANKLNGVMFKIKYQEAVIPVQLPSMIGRPAVSAALAATAAGLAFGLNGIEISEALRLWIPAPGRLRLLRGVNDSVIIDDTYNAAPQSMLAALEVLDEIRLFGAARKWAVLADMLELGSDSEKGHLEVGKQLAVIPKARLLYLGSQANYIAIGARKAGLAEDRIQAFNNTQEIVDYLLERIEPNDLILVKGSQGMRMEKVVKGLLTEGELADKLLVRQGEGWSS